jgi:hypothetical protein
VWGDAGARGERCGFHRAAGTVIETDLGQPYLDGVTAPIDRGRTGRALSHPSRSAAWTVAHPLRLPGQHQPATAGEEAGGDPGDRLLRQ